MGFVIPSSKSKRYLSGSDWIIHTLDYILKSKTRAGNMSQVVLMLNSTLNAKLLQEHLSEFIAALPVILGRVKRDYTNLAPYWYLPLHQRPDVKLNVLKSDEVLSVEDALLLLEKKVNEQFSSVGEHLVFHYIGLVSDKSCLAMTFDHSLFDGRGAEMFLNLFQRYLTEDNKSSVTSDFIYSAPAQLSDWKIKFNSGRNVNRKIVALTETPVAALPVPSGRRKGFNFKFLSLNPDESKSVYDAAYKEAGYLMEMPYLLAVVIKAVHKLFAMKGMAAGSYLIPVSIDMRTGEDFKKELFFNHMSYLFFQVLADDADDMPGMIRKIKYQMYEQVKSGFPRDIQNACLLTRIAPPSLLSRIFSLPFEGKLASFCFSHVGQSSYIFDEFAGAQVNNILHMPRVTVPPGLGVFFNYYNERLNLVISCLEGLLADEEISMLEADLKENLSSCQH